MKRMFAYFIDYILITLIIYGVRDNLFKITDNFPILWILFVLVIYIYFWINDIFFKGSSIGKKIVKLNIELKDMPIVKFATIHTIFKIAFTFIWAISIIMYLSRHCTMPYDKFFYKNIE